MSIDRQAAEVDRVKRTEHGVITDPFYLYPDNLVEDALELMSRYRISGVPIVDEYDLRHSHQSRCSLWANPQAHR